MCMEGLCGPLKALPAPPRESPCPKTILLRKCNCISCHLCFPALLWSKIQACTSTCPSWSSGRALLFAVFCSREGPLWSYPSKDSTSHSSKWWSPVFTGVWCILSTCNKLLLFLLQLLETFPVPGVFIRTVRFLLPKRRKYLFFSYYLLAYSIVWGTVPGRGTPRWEALGKHGGNGSDRLHHGVLAIQTATSVKEFERRDVTQAKGRLWQFANTEWVAWFFFCRYVHSLSILKEMQTEFILDKSMCRWGLLEFYVRCRNFFAL